MSKYNNTFRSFIGFLCFLTNFLTLLLKKLFGEQMIEVGVWGQNKEKSNSSRRNHFHCRKKNYDFSIFDKKKGGGSFTGGGGLLHRQLRYLHNQ